MSDDNNISIAAIVVALVALIVALGQLFGQYFATADGYRRCQPSVMGRWAKFTRLRWRWSQFRFETLYTTPEITFVRRSVTGPLYGTAYSCVQQPDLFQMPEKHYMGDEGVCWLLLLDSLQITSSFLEKHQYVMSF